MKKIIIFYNFLLLFLKRFKEKNEDNRERIEEIDEYIKTNEPMDKAGAYAIQGIGAKFIKTIDGDYYTIMGLPIGELYHRIQKYL